jgi:hypothetical protein
MDQLTGAPPVPTDLAFEQQIRRVYNDLNNPDLARRGIDAYAGPTKPLPENVVSPETRGYHPAEVDGELWAEAFRAYKANPSYIKRVAPDVAKALRAKWNSDPRLARILHPNSLAPLALMGLGGLGAGLVGSGSSGGTGT